jgi:hypothetical protein
MKISKLLLPENLVKEAMLFAMFTPVVSQFTLPEKDVNDLNQLLSLPASAVVDAEEISQQPTACGYSCSGSCDGSCYGGCTASCQGYMQ